MVRIRVRAKVRVRVMVRTTLGTTMMESLGGEREQVLLKRKFMYKLGIESVNNSVPVYLSADKKNIFQYFSTKLLKLVGK